MTECPSYRTVDEEQAKSGSTWGHQIGTMSNAVRAPKLFAPLRYLLLAVLVAPGMYGNRDISVAVGDGMLLLENVSFIKHQGLDYLPLLSFRITNRSHREWTSLNLRFDIGGICDGIPRQWSTKVVFNPLGLSFKVDPRAVEPAGDYHDWVLSLRNEIKGCTAELFRVIDMSEGTHDPADFTEQLRTLIGERKAEQERVKAEQAKQDAAESARRAKMRLEAEAKAEEERRNLRAACGQIYRGTANKKVSDLTVKEEQQVRACQTLGMYPPR